ncbi:ACR COG1678 domain containing protein [Nitzschia inconspicua]|uniref:ACR COG1678 domain containing protein n=1 Tax=Nitzschia inconspicua TaxID=303405 RepID=A0A9K3KQZ9_9STRA|nr:ACR COG1678 domain containing protein [Nitzschia inconspicua]
MRSDRFLISVVVASSISSSRIVVSSFSSRSFVPTRILAESRSVHTLRKTTPLFSLEYPSFDGEDEDDDENDDEDEYIDTDTLGDWRNFRRSLTLVMEEDEINADGDSDTTTSLSSKTQVSTKDGDAEQLSKPKSKSQKKSVSVKSVSKDNEEVLKSQNKNLAEEYLNGVWAHETSTPEVGGLVIRMPLEVELFRNYRHSLMGSRLKRLLDQEGVPRRELEISTWYARSKRMIEEEMSKIANMADDEGQIDATQLKEESSEMLSLYLDNQESWQEVCLVVEKQGGNARTVVLNRPMAFQLTENIGKLVLHGAFQSQKQDKVDKQKELVKFMMAFKRECAVYVGGPDEQGNPAVMIHGIKDLPGAVEISPGTQIFQGGIDSAVQGILEGKYSPLEFRFFLGCHVYEESALDVEVHLGKYQPVACARSVALKQCISLPKPLWHEVAELCGGYLEDLSSLELLKREDLQFQVVDETDYDEDDEDDDDVIEIEIDDEDDEYPL